jgi:hypothetical protein
MRWPSHARAARHSRSTVVFETSSTEATSSTSSPGEVAQLDHLALPLVQRPELVERAVHVEQIHVDARGAGDRLVERHLQRGGWFQAIEPARVLCLMPTTRRKPVTRGTSIRPSCCPTIEGWWVW